MGYAKYVWFGVFTQDGVYFCQLTILCRKRGKCYKNIRYSRKDRQFPIDIVALDWQFAIHTVALPRGNCQFIRTLDVAGIALPLVGSCQSTVAYQSIP